MLLNVAGDAVVGPVELAALAGVVRPVQEVEQEEGQGEQQPGKEAGDGDIIWKYNPIKFHPRSVRGAVQLTWQNYLFSRLN